jgi:hypothetical protein
MVTYVLPFNQADSVPSTESAINEELAGYKRILQDIAANSKIGSKGKQN